MWVSTFMGVPTGTEKQGGGLGLASLKFLWALACQVCPYCLCLAFKWSWRGNRGPEYESLREEVGVYRLWAAPCTYERRVLYYLSELAGPARSRLSKVSKTSHVMSKDQKYMIKTIHCSKWLTAPLILTMDLPSGKTDSLALYLLPLVAPWTWSSLRMGAVSFSMPRMTTKYTEINLIGFEV